MRLIKFWYLVIQIIFTQPFLSDRIWHKFIFKQSLTSLNSDFSFSWTSCLAKAEELSLPYYLLIAGGRIIGFIPFPSVLVLCEMQLVSSRIWTRVTVSISYDDNDYTTGICDTNGSFNPAWKTNIWVNEQEIRKADFTITVDHMVKIKEREKKNTWTLPEGFFKCRVWGWQWDQVWLVHFERSPKAWKKRLNILEIREIIHAILYMA